MTTIMACGVGLWLQAARRVFQILVQILGCFTRVVDIRSFRKPSNSKRDNPSNWLACNA